MRLKSRRVIPMVIASIGCMIFAVTSPDCMAQQFGGLGEEWSRAGKGELSLLIGTTQSTTGEWEEEYSIPFGRAWTEIKGEVEDSFLFGFGGGYNFNDHLNLNTHVLFAEGDVDARMDYEAEVSASILGYSFGGHTSGRLEGSGDASLLFWDVNLDVNILKTRLTPVVSAGIGLLAWDFDFDVAEALDIDLAEAADIDRDLGDEGTEVTYNVGVGLRWDVTDNLMLKALYRPTWAALEGEDFRFDSVTLSVGWLF